MYRIGNARGLALAFVCLGVGLGSGCKQDEPKKPKSKTMDGVITRVDADKGRLAMKMRDPKNKNEFLPKEVEGSVTPTTSIWINGKAAKLADLRVKDTVEATGYRQGKGENEQIIAERINVERPIEVISKPAPVAPAPPPAAKPMIEPAKPLAPQPTPPMSQTPAATSQPSTEVSEARIGMLRLMVQEFKKKRGEAAAAKAQLLKDGLASDDPKVLEQDTIVAKADMYLAEAEDEAAKRGIVLRDMPDSSQPASAPDAAKP